MGRSFKARLEIAALRGETTQLEEAEPAQGFTIRTSRMVIYQITTTGYTHTHTHKTRMYAQSSKTMKGCTHLGCDCYHEDEVLVCFKEHLNFKTLVY